jgi:hypothetical protein
MNLNVPFPESIHDDEMRIAERELAAFIGAVTTLYGPEQANISAEEWLDELALMDARLRSEHRHWRTVTIAACARLADHVKDVSRQISLGA